MVEELQNNQVVKSYTYGLDLISQKTGAIVSFYNYDGHGSVRNLTNLAGQITDTYDYDAFGTIINRTGTTDNNYLYAGEQFDADLGFYYNRARYLNVQTGRFISQDSFEGSKSEPRSLHKYVYGADDVADKIDPSGNFGIADALTVLTVVGILATMEFSDYLRDAAPRDFTEQLPEDISTTDVNYNSEEISGLESNKADDIFDYIASFRGLDGSGTRVLSGPPVTGSGQIVTFGFRDLKYFGQNDFDVRTVNFNRAERIMSVVTLSGHPLSGWRFWEVRNLPNGNIFVRTGGVDSPTRANDIFKAVRLGGNEAQLSTWETLLNNIVSNFSGARRVSDDVSLMGERNITGLRQEFLEKAR